MNKLPDNWKEVKLGDIVDIIMGQSPKSQFYNKRNEGMPFLQGSSTFGLLYPTFEVYSSNIKKIAVNGSVLMSVRAPVGDLNIANADICIGRGLCSINGKNKYLNRYIYYLLNYYKPQLMNMQKGTTFGAITKDDILNFEVLITEDAEEQKRIASALSKVDAYLENTIKLTESKERFKRAITKKLLTCKENKNVPEARFEGFKDEWKKYNLSKIGISYGGLKNKKAKSFLENCNAKYITYKSIYDKSKIDIDRLENVFVDKNENQNLVKYGDAFFTISSETPNELAMSSILLDEVENTYLNSFCFGFRFDFNILLPKFARYYFRSDYIRKSTYKLAQGSTRYNISKNKFLDIIIYLPSLEEQEKIGEFLSLLDAEIDNLKKQAESIKRLKKGLMKKLMSGEIRV